MDPPPLSSVMLQSSEMDTVMADHTENGDLQNGMGTMDPRVLNQADELDLSTEETSREESSQQSSVAAPEVSPRKKYLPTGCCYDDRMKLHANADFSSNPHHPEDPRRIEEIMKEFKDGGLIYTGSRADLAEVLKSSPTQWMWRIAARKAREDEICLVHTKPHFEWVKALGEMTSAELRNLTNEFDNGRKSLYVGSLTYEAALISAGGAIETCKSVVAGNVKNAIAVIRPPGHHAEHNESMGFCIFNNVPIAAKVCMEDYPDTCKKVMILDWDVHHGNGIQNMFYNDPNILYISLHVYQNGSFYPGQPDDDGIPDGGLENCGVGAGEGYNVNIGWHDQGMGDGEYMAAFQKIVMPIAQEFNPDLVIISAGFDAAAGDELGGCWVSPACYSHMTHMLMSLAGGKVAVCLEGGYNLRAISRSALAVAKTLMGEPPERMIELPPINREAEQVLDNVKRIQSVYWNCMKPGVVPLRKMNTLGAERISDVIRTAQRSKLAEKHTMMPLYIHRDKLSRTFKNQVLVTPDLYRAKKIMLILHDPPEVLAQPDPLDNRVLSHNAFMTDRVAPYIDRFIAAGFGIIDVNVPSHLPPLENDTDPFLPKASETAISVLIKELLCYIWDNHIEINERASVSIMGVGEAYLGVKALLTARDVKSKIPGILSFVTGSLRPIKSETDIYLSSWYKSNSLIYVSPDHACWLDADSVKRVKKNRFGLVKMSEASGLGGMLQMYEDEGVKWASEKVREWEREHGESEDDVDELGDGRVEVGGNGGNGKDPDETEDEGEGLGVGEVSMRAPM